MSYRYAASLFLLLNFISMSCYAQPAARPAVLQANPQKLVSYVDTKTSDCQKLTSSPMVIVAGAGGANMELKCPADKPVLTYWKQHEFFTPSVLPPFLMVAGGGGESVAYCCPTKSKWINSSDPG